VAIDTNILVYADGHDGPKRRAQARGILDALHAHQLVIPIQVLGELFAVLQRKTGRSVEMIVQDIAAWQETALCVPTTGSVLIRAGDLVTDHKLNVWDAVIFAASAEAGSRLLLSEDMQDGFSWGGVTLINPFHPAGLARMQALIG